MSLLKPSRDRHGRSVNLHISAAQAARLDRIREAAAAAGRAIDLSDALRPALDRLLDGAEHELGLAPPSQQGTDPGGAPTRAVGTRSARRGTAAARPTNGAASPGVGSDPPAPTAG